MKTCRSIVVALSALLVVGGPTTPLRAQEKPSTAKASPTPAGQSGEAEMMAKMMELAKPGEPHRLLAQMVGTWGYKVKFAAAPGAELAEAGKGTAVRTAIMGGRYFTLNVTGKMLMPGADGKIEDTEFKGMSIEGYDNVKQKFVCTWIDNMGTSIILSEGSYDPASKSFTYNFEMEEMPGMKTKARQVVKLLDADHTEMDWYEIHGEQESKTMEIDYARQK